MKEIITKSKRDSAKSGIVFLQRVVDSKASRAKQLRQCMTVAEAVMWRELRNRKLYGFKFRRQQVIDGFIVDFYCEEAKLVVEIDGHVHDIQEQKHLDKHRENVLITHGLSIIRIRNEEIETQLKEVLEKVKQILIENATSPRPSATPLRQEWGKNEPN